MNKKYEINAKENKEFLQVMRDELLEFGKRFPSPGGSSYYLGDDGTPIIEKNRETWISSRMVHVYSIGHMLGFAGAKELAQKGLMGLTNELKDKEHGGWYAGLTADGAIIPNKQCYAHAFVILAATSAYLAGCQGAKELLDEALDVFDKYFWDEDKGLVVDTWDTAFECLDQYRGLNANMHTVEAFLAVADATGNEEYRIRAERIINRVLSWASENSYRIPEHYSSQWEVMLEMNRENPDDQFKPYGATPGHGIEWSRLIVQWATSSKNLDEAERSYYIDTAKQLYNRAVADAWNTDGKPGIAYTTDWTGKPIVSDRMHWTLAEAINTSAVLYRVTKEEDFAKDYQAFMEYLDLWVHDKKNGSWFHQLDENNQLKETVWPGKPDLYHAFQATLIPYAPVGISIAKTID